MAKEYIERKVVLKKNMYGNANPITHRTYAEELIKSIPAADVVEVKHGEWTYQINSGERLGGTDATYDYQCSVCNQLALENSNYCPNCGAKMDRKEKGDV